MIVRQHDETCLHEIHNQTLIEFVASKYYYNDKKICDANLLFVKFKESGWHRFFLDVGVLFWQQVEELDLEELTGIDGLHEFKLIDVGESYNLKGIVINSVEMRQVKYRAHCAGRLTMQFERGVKIELTGIYGDESNQDFSDYTIMSVENA